MVHVHDSSGRRSGKPISRSDNHLNVEPFESHSLQKSRRALSHSMHSIKSAAAQLSPPDGGFGWVVVLGSFFIHVVADGITYAFGVLLPILLDEFKEGESITAAVGSTLFGVTLVVGPIVAALVNRYGCRPVTCLGALVATVGTIISTFSFNITFMLLTFGILTGFGFGLIYLPAIVSVTQWFEKKRAFATGIAVCGSGVGTMVFSPISDRLVDAYSWNGALLILAGVILNCAIFGALFRPVEYDIIAVSAEFTAQHESAFDDDLNEAQRQPKTSSVGLGSQKALQVERNALGFTAKSDTHIHFHGNQRYSNRFHQSPLRQTNSHSWISQERSHLRLASIDADGEVSDVTDVALPPLGRKDALYTGSLSNIPLYRNDLDQYKVSVLDLSKASTKEMATVDKDELPEKKDGWWRKTGLVVKDLLDPSLFTDWIFIYFTISNLLTSLAFQIPYIFLVDRAVHLGITKESSAWLLSTVGLANIFGRVGFGLLADRPNVNKLWLYNGAVTIAGLAMIVTIWCNDFVSNVACAAFYGIFIGAFVTLTPVLLVELFGLERLTNAFGNLLLFQGLATFLGPPLGGYLKESFGNYDSTFVAFGIMMAVSGAMLFVIPCLQNVERRFKQKGRERDEFTAKPQNGVEQENLPLMKINEKQPQVAVPSISLNNNRLPPSFDGAVVA